MAKQRQAPRGLYGGLLLLAVIGILSQDSGFRVQFLHPEEVDGKYEKHIYNRQLVDELPRRSDRATPKHKLEFMHIAKSGGSAIVRAAAHAGIMWGECHYQKFEGVECFSPDMESPRIKRGSDVSGVRWHMPYKHLLGAPLSDTTDTFAVVRNPYDRVVSSCYCPWDGSCKGLVMVDKNKRKRIFNEEIKRTVKRGRDEHKGKWMPQSEFVFDESGKNRLIDHILYYESLGTEFNELMDEYSLNVVLPSKEKGTNVSHKMLSKCDLNPDTITMVNEYMASDFTLFGYQMVKSADEFPGC